MLASSEKRTVQPRWQRRLWVLVQSSLLPKQFSAAGRSILSRLKIARAYSIVAQDASLVVTLAVGRDPRERDVVWIDDTKKSFRTFRVGKMAAKPSV